MAGASSALCQAGATPGGDGEGALCHLQSFSPTNKTVKVPADVAKKIINGPADIEKRVLFDWGQVAKQRPQWTEKWNKEMR